MLSPIQTLKKWIDQSSTSNVPRGELWLGTDFLKAAGLEDTVENHLALAERLDHGIFCLPVSAVETKRPDLGYRYFSVQDVRKGIKISDRPVFAVIDGPFQEMVNGMGLMDILAGWTTKREEIMDAYRVASDKTLALILQVLAHLPAAVVITDDMAFDNGPLISPSELKVLCRPFYEQAVKHIHACNIPVLLHSCGNITSLIPIYKKWAVDGFAAIQSGMNDLEDIYREFDSEIMLMAGIENDLLDADTFPEAALQKLDQLISVLGKNGSLILGSSCGLYKGEYLKQIRRIYAL